MDSRATQVPLRRENMPLVALLGQAHDAFADEVDARLRASEFDGLSLAHSRNVLRHLLAGPRRASQLVTVCDVSKQAISQQLASLQRHGYVEVIPDPHDQRARLAGLTKRGRAAQALVAAALREVEEDWRAALGAETVDQLRAMLLRVPGSRSRC